MRDHTRQDDQAGGRVLVPDSGVQMLNVMREVEAASHVDPTSPPANRAASLPIDLRILEALAKEPFDMEAVLERLVRNENQD
ncbi:hypothetical protein [Streptomyces sp. NPDC008139]|uniref:hypothetical protein n=1 Tax=Streptomyces sp. NPDC008139 TaxID=3364814 RepID=UPI0036E9B7D8